MYAAWLQRLLINSRCDEISQNVKSLEICMFSEMMFYLEFKATSDDSEHADRISVM